MLYGMGLMFAALVIASTVLLAMGINGLRSWLERRRHR